MGRPKKTAGALGIAGNTLVLRCDSLLIEAIIQHQELHDIPTPQQAAVELLRLGLGQPIDVVMAITTRRRILTEANQWIRSRINKSLQDIGKELTGDIIPDLNIDP